MNVMRPIGQMCLVGLIGLVSLITFSCLLVSCGGGAAGEDDLSAPQGMVANEEMVPITFSGSQGTETTVTRAGGSPLSDKGITRFQVWGYKNTAEDYSTYQTVFPCYQVDWHANSAATTTTNTNNWEYILVGKPEQTIKFWDWAATAYRFFAATGWSEETPGTPGEYVAGKTYGSANEISMIADASPGATAEETATKRNATPYFSRLWFSTGDQVAYPDKQFGKPVTLEFLKPYARVRFIYTYVYPREGVTITSQSFKPSATEEKIYRKGVVTVTYPLTGAETKESYSMTPTAADDPAHLAAFIEDYDPDDDTKEYTTCDDGWYTVLPNTSQGSYTLTVNIKGLGERTAVVPATYMQWKAGYSYTYIFKITEEGGVAIGWVDYAVVPWVEMTISTSVYNW